MRAERSARVRRVAWLVALLLGGGALAVAGGQASGSFRQTSSVIANGGGASAGATQRETSSVIGQPTEGGLSASSSYINTEGFVPPPEGSSAPVADVWVVR